MTDDRLSQSELEEMFGPTVPMDAVELIFNPTEPVDLGKLRAQLRTMGMSHKRKRAAQDAAIVTMEYIKSHGPDLPVRDQAEMVALATIDAYEAWREPASI